MDKAGAILGGTIGTVMILVLFTVLVIAPPESLKSSINNDNSNIVADAVPTTPTPTTPTPTTPTPTTPTPTTPTPTTPTNANNTNNGSSSSNNNTVTIQELVIN